MTWGGRRYTPLQQTTSQVMIDVISTGPTAVYLMEAHTKFAIFIMNNPHEGENEFAEMQYMNIIALTSNQPYGALDDSNPQITGNSMPKFNVHKNGVHSDHVRMGMQNPFCLQKG
ncbi:hypothetical protein GQ457_06G020300 [Hibiscus cannabinus]